MTNLKQYYQAKILELNKFNNLDGLKKLTQEAQFKFEFIDSNIIAQLLTLYKTDFIKLLVWKYYTFTNIASANIDIIKTLIYSEQVDVAKTVLENVNGLHTHIEDDCVNANDEHMQEILMGIKNNNIKTVGIDELKMAVCNLDIESVKSVVADCQSLSKSVISTAIKYSNPEFIKELIDAGYQISVVSISDIIEFSFLFTGSEILDLIEYMIQHGDTVFKDALHHNTISQIINNQRLNDEKLTVKLVKYLIDNGAKFSDYDNTFNKLCEFYSLDEIKFMFNDSSKVPVNSIFVAIECSRLDVVKHLVDIGVEISQNAVDHAIKYSNLKMVEYLVNDKEDFTAIVESILLNSKNPIIFSQVVEYILDNNFSTINFSYKHFMQVAHNSRAFKLLSKHISNDIGKFHEIASTLFNKGNYEQAAKLSEYANTCANYDIVDEVAKAIALGLSTSTEEDKNHAISNLFSRIGISVASYISKSDLHKLAAHYINLSKLKFINSFEKSEINPEVSNLINSAFDINNHERHDVLIKLKAMFPNNVALKQVDTEFDSYLTVAGKALDRLDHDFALEVLNINGYSLTPLNSDVTVFRGYATNIDEGGIQSLFKHGTRAFGNGEFQKTLGYHVKDIDYGINLWELCGTYVSFSPSVAGSFSQTSHKSNKKDKLVLEIKLPKGSPQICGMSQEELELVPSKISGDEIIAVYKVSHQYDKSKVLEVYQNPYIDINNTFKVNDYIITNKTYSDTYDNLGCRMQNIEDYQYSMDNIASYFEGRDQLFVHIDL